MSRKEKQIDYAAELEKDYAIWQDLYENGGSDPFWSDGVNMNLVRNHIICDKRMLEEQMPMFIVPEVYYRELPPEMPNDYMAQPDKIREDARKALQAFEKDENLKYLREHESELSDKVKKRLCIPAVIGYADGLHIYIEQDELIDMRRYRQYDHYLESFASAVQRLNDRELIARIEGQPMMRDDDEESCDEQDCGEEIEDDEQESCAEEPESCEPEEQPSEFLQLTFIT